VLAEECKQDENHAVRSASRAPRSRDVASAYGLRARQRFATAPLPTANQGPAPAGTGEDTLRKDLLEVFSNLRFYDSMIL